MRSFLYQNGKYLWEDYREFISRLMYFLLIISAFYLFAVLIAFIVIFVRRRLGGSNDFEGNFRFGRVYLFFTYFAFVLLVLSGASLYVG